MSDGADAPGLNAVLGQSGACPEIVHNGKTWKIGHPTQEAKTILNMLVVKRASDEVEKKEKILPPGVAARLFSVLADRIFAKHFETWHQGWLETMGSQDGDILFLLSLIRLSHPTATERDVFDLYTNCPGPVKVALALVMPPFLDLMEKEFPPQMPTEQRTELMGQLREKYRSLPELST